MVDHQMEILDGPVITRRRRNVNVFSGEMTQPATIESGQADRDRTNLIGILDRIENIRRVAAGGNGEDHIARREQRLELFREHGLVAEVVAGSGQQGVVVRQTDDPIRLPAMRARPEGEIAREVRRR